MACNKNIFKMDLVLTISVLRLTRALIEKHAKALVLPADLNQLMLPKSTILGLECMKLFLNFPRTTNNNDDIILLPIFLLLHKQYTKNMKIKQITI